MNTLLPHDHLPVDLLAWLLLPGPVGGGWAWAGRDDGAPAYFAAGDRRIVLGAESQIDLRVTGQTDCVRLGLAPGRSVQIDVTGLTWFGQRAASGLHVAVAIEADGTLVLAVSAPAQLTARCVDCQTVVARLRYRTAPGLPRPTAFELLAGDSPEALAPVAVLSGAAGAWHEDSTAIELSEQPTRLSARALFGDQPGPAVRPIRLTWPTTPSEPLLAGGAQ